MRKSILARFGALSCLLIAFQANAVMINHVSYKPFASTGTKCPDGSSIFVYNGVSYCKAYHLTISWVPPSTRTNGSALQMSELTGYEVYWTRTSDNSKGTVRVSGGSTLSAPFDSYKIGTYYFAMSAIDTKGVKSPLSTMIQAKLGN
jgi:hypothetical protein